VETANADYASICQVGVVRVVDGAMTDEYVTLVDPEDWFDPWNSRVGPGRRADVSIGRFPRSAPPNRTCGFHRIRLSTGRLGMSQRCSLVWISSTRTDATSDVGHGTLVFTGDLLAFQSHRC